jgi:hypothetical protein
MVFTTHLVAHIHRMMQEDFLYGHPDEKLTILHSPHEIWKPTSRT